MTEGQNAETLQRLSEEQRAATQSETGQQPTTDATPAPSQGTETSDAASIAPDSDDPPAAVPPAEPVAKAPTGRRGTSTAT
jgi:hypothetical protein